MKIPWIVLVILYYIITTSAHTRETPDFSCYFGNWTNGVCKFPWDGITDFNQCSVLLTIQDLKKDEENLRIFCDYEVSVCSIKIDFSLYDDLYGLYTTWANIRICFETEEYIDAKPFHIERKEVTKANPPEEIVVKTATPTNATLDWTNPDYCIDLDYHVRAEVSSNSRDSFKDIYWSEYNCSESVRGSIFIPNLPYSDHNYLVKIRQKYVSAPDLEKFWSDEVVYGFRTKPSRPRVSPQTALGAFHTAHGGNVTIFWVGLEKKYWSASNFTYIVSYCHDYQFNTQSNSSRHVLWLNELDGQPSEYSVLKIPEGDLEICLRSGNSFGKSESFTKMKIFDTSLPPIRWVKKVLTNNTYEIIWSVSPAEKVTQFKLFVCKVDSVESESCRSSIVKVMKLSRKNFRYRYESEEILAFAVAPIYGDKSPGMTWARRRTKLPEILIRGVEPVNTTSVKILWSPLRDSLSSIKTNISLIYLNPNEPEGSLTISKANSKMQQEGIYWTEIGGLSPESSVTIKYDDDLLPVRSCPNAVKFDLRHGVASVNVHFYPDRNSLWTTKLNGSVKEDKSQGSKLVLENLQRHTTYLLEVESYTMDNGRKQCVLGQRKLFRTKSGKPGAVITKVINDGISLHLDCKVEENINEDTVYEMKLTVKRNRAEGNSSKVTSKECKFRIPYECDDNLFGYEYSMRAVNDAVDEEDDAEGIPGPWSEVAFYNVNDLCQRREFIALTFMLITLGIVVFFLILYLVLAKYYNLKEMNELKVDIPKALKEPSIEESHKNGPIQQNNVKMEEITECVPLLDLRMRVKVEKSPTQIREYILNIGRFNNKEQDSESGSDGFASNLHEEVVDAEIHRDLHSNASQTSIPDIAVIGSSEPTQTPPEKSQEAPSTSVYYKVSDLKILPNQVKGPTEDTPPFLNGYVARQGFRPSPEHVKQFLGTSYYK